MTHSGCGYEQAKGEKIQKGKKEQKARKTETVQGKYVLSHGLRGEKGRKPMVPGVEPPPSFFLSSSSLLTLPLLLPFSPLQLSP